MARHESTSLITHVSNDLKWTDSICKDMKWLHMANNEGEEDIVERFTYMSNINRSNNKRTDREEIRRRLAMGSDNDDYYNGERINRKPSLQSRLQSGMNLQICFINETNSDSESVNSDSEISNISLHDKKINGEKCTAKRPDSLAVNKCHIDGLPSYMRLPSISKFSNDEEFKMKLINGSDFLKYQAQLQSEARLALAQAKEMAHMQMEIERQRHKISPISDMIRKSLEKVGISFPADRRRLSRQILTEMNIAQLQIIANDLHTKIEVLNEKLVRYLIGRDDLHMEQDSMLVDIEDLTRYFHVKKLEHLTLLEDISEVSPPYQTGTSSVDKHRVKKSKERDANRPET